MTDSLKFCLDLRSMPDEARREVEVHHAQTRNKRHENVGEPYAKPRAAVSPCSGTGMTLITYWEGSGRDFLQSQIVVDSNIPNSTVGHNCQHGTSVFAAGVAGLELVKIMMAREGVPVDALAALNTSHISLHGATITYLLKVATEEEARAIVLHMKSAARILGLSPKGLDSTNETIVIARNGFLLTVYYKTDFSHCAIDDPDLREKLQSQARCIVRIEVYMQGHFLRKRGWEALESWRHAYAEGRYAAIFEEMVRGIFKLGLVLRHKAPRQEALKRLTSTECAIVESYLAGTPADALPSIKNGQTADARSKIKSKWRTLILQKVRIDISIPWKQHQQLHHAELNRTLQYPGDYEPDASDTPYCFCKASWPTLLGHLKMLFEKEVKRQAAI